MLTHAFAFERIHVGCILVQCINMHSPAYTFVASQCIQYMVHLHALSCIYNTMHLHPLLHYHAFGARDAFMCITVCMHSERDAYKCIWMHANALHSDAFQL